MEKNINKTAVINIAASLVMQIISFCTIPLFTALLGAEQYGMYSVYMSWLMVLECFMGLCMKNAIPTGIHRYESSYLEFRNSILLFANAAGIGVSLLAFLFSSQLTRVLGYDSRMIVVLFLTALAYSDFEFFSFSNIYEKKPVRNFLASVGISLATVFFSIVLIQRAGEGLRWQGKIYGYSLPYIFSGILLFSLLYFEKPVSFHAEYIRYGLSVGSPMIFHMFSQSVLTQSDRIMMDKLGTPESQIGIYSVFYTLATVLFVILNALNNSFVPFYYDDLRQGKETDAKKKCYGFIELFTVLTAGFVLLSPEVAKLLAAEDFMSGLNLLPVLSFAMYFMFMAQFPVNLEMYHEKTKVIAVCTCLCAVLNIALNFWLIPPYGMFGAAVATAASYLFLFLIHWAIVRKLGYRLQIGALLPGFFAVLLAAAVFFLLPGCWTVRWMLGATLGITELARIKKRHSLF